MGHRCLQLSTLFTTYGGTRFDRLSYLGGNWEYSADGNLSLYFNQAKDVWNQAFFSLKDGAGDLQSPKWGGNLNAYRSREQGKQLQGKIDNTAYSLSPFAARRAVTVSLIYQRILGDQYFDYTGETWGIYLENAMNVDYNAPHEQSIQLRGVIDGAALSYPGFKFMLWALAGWGADGTAESGKHAPPASPMHILYWEGGHIVRGSHREIGINPTYTVQTGHFKDTKISLIATVHKSSPYYPDDGNKEFKLTVDFPLKAF